MKKCQISKLKHNPKFKAIAIINTAQKACLCQNSLDQWLDCNNELQGDLVVVIGKQETELKHALTTGFPNYDFDKN